MIPRIAVAVLAALTAPLWTSPPPAQAHPFGDPQSVSISETPTGVRVEWRAEPDDVTALAAFLGVVGGEHIVVFEDGEYDEEESSVSPGLRLAEAAPVVSDYLLAHVRVNAEGEECAGTLEPLDDVTSSGAGLVFDCGRAVTDVEVQVSTLTDINPAYRTVAVGPGGVRRVYSMDRDTFSWHVPDSASAPSAGRSAAVQLGGTTAAVALAGVGLWGLRRRHRRRSRAAETVVDTRVA